MRVIGKLLALAGVTGAAVVGLATPASASHQCPASDRCVITDAFTIPVGTPALGGAGAGPYVVPGPRLCDTSTGSCTSTFVLLPGAYVSVGGSTITTVTVPAFGVGIGSDGVVTVYYGVPGVDPSSTGLPDVEVALHVPYVPVVTGDIGCASTYPIDLGPVWAAGNGCYLTVRVRV